MTATVETSRRDAWLAAMRPQTLPAGAAPVLMGIGLAAADGMFALWPAVAALVGTVEQRTPSRVDRRRADKVREREVYEATGEIEDGDDERGRKATVELHTEGGLYVKELVSGDEGRTAKSLSSLLGVSATVEELDVLAVVAEGEVEFVE